MTNGIGTIPAAHFKRENMNSSTHLRIIAALLIGLPMTAQADTYLDWSENISKASRGLTLCNKEREKSLAGNLQPRDKKRLTEVAAHQCKIFKGVFDTTMLAARGNISGMDKPLADYHDAVMLTF